MDSSSSNDDDSIPVKTCPDEYSSCMTSENPGSARSLSVWVSSRGVTRDTICDGETSIGVPSDVSVSGTVDEIEAGTA